jgi:hypothetical protein
MMAWAGRRLWLAVRMVIRAVTMAHHEQVRMWECVLLTSGAAPLTAAGPLRWFPSVDGYQLAGSHLPARGPSETGRQLELAAAGPDLDLRTASGSARNIPSRRIVSG